MDCLTTPSTVRVHDTFSYVLQVETVSYVEGWHTLSVAGVVYSVGIESQLALRFATPTLMLSA
jgi:hypothetical protein